MMGELVPGGAWVFASVMAVMPLEALDREGASWHHPVEAYCTEYRLDGPQSGTVTECSRGHGAQRVEFQKLASRQGTDMPPLHHKVIYDGGTVTAVDLLGRRALRVRDPIHAELAALVSGRNGTEIAEDFGRALGGEPTGERQQVAGHDCAVWETRQGSVDARWCISADGILLSFRMPHVKKTALRVEIGEGGPDTHYAVPSDVLVVESGDPSAVDVLLGQVH